MNKKINVYLPETWVQDLEIKLSEHPPKFKPFFLDCFKFIGQLPYYIASHRHENDYEYGFVPVSKSKLRDRIHEYRKYLNYLIQNGFLEEDADYYVRKYSGGLRYPEKYRKQEVVTTEITKPTLVKNIIKSRNKNNSGLNDEKDIQNYDYLAKWLEGLEIDQKKALEIAKGIYEAEKLSLKDYKPKLNWQSNPKKWKKKRKPRPDNFDYAEFRYRLRTVVINQIKNQDVKEAKKDSSAGRLHTFLTKLKKDLRKTITYRGQKLVAVDIVNSQPYFLNSLLNPYIFINTDMGETIKFYNPTLSENLPEFFDQISTYKHYNIENNLHNDNKTYNYTYINTNNTKEENNKCTIMFVNFISEQYGKPDTQKYIQWVTEGVFYDKFAMELVDKEILPNDSPKNRDKAKEITFNILFGKNDSERRVKKTVKAFKTVFPSVFEITQIVKLGDPKNRTHATLACALQSLEARLILDDCCGTIAKENPEIPIFTIHDSIVTTQGNETIVQEVIERVFQQYFGNAPKVKLEYW